ncbi:MAG: hypothetical protein HC845_06370 [Akkermansiaceae bacterium]|nr:hypothetical protein [Akkermansiaceae bacterium]
MRKPHLALLFLATVASSHAEIRPWRNSDATRTIQGKFIKRDEASVTILDESKKEISIPFTKLHAEDKKWLDTNHSLNGQVIDPNAFFDGLTFKDTRDSALTKLKSSQLVEMTADETFIGRTGLMVSLKLVKKSAASQPLSILTGTKREI